MQVNIFFLSAAPNTCPEGTFDLDYSGRRVIPLTRETIGGATHGIDFSGASATVRFEPDETTAFLRVFPQADDENEDGEGVKIGFGTAPQGVRIGAPSTATVMFEEPGMPAVNMNPSPGTISENRGVSTVSAWLGCPTEYDVTVRVETGDPSSPDDFTLSDNRTLTIPAGSKWSTGTGTVTAVDNVVHEPDRPEGTVTGLPGGDGGERADAVHRRRTTPSGWTLRLSPRLHLGERRRQHGDGATQRHGERRRHGDGRGLADGARGRERLHAERDDADDRGGLTVAATPESRAVVGDFELSATRVLTETVTITCGAVSGVTGAHPDVEPSNRPPAFSARIYAFEMWGQPRGCFGDVRVGAVRAADPDREPVTYAWLLVT